MEIIKVTSENISDAINRAAEIIKSCGVVAIPTDTSYGLAANAFEKDCVLKVFKIKRRSLHKPLSIFVDSIKTIEKLFVIDEIASKFLALLPEKLTLILKTKYPKLFPEGILNSDGAVGVRYPLCIYPVEIARISGVPITATSANLSGEPPIYEPSLIIAKLENVDLLLDAGILPRRPVSTVIDLSKKPPIVLREGAFPVKKLVKITGIKIR